MTATITKEGVQVRVGQVWRDLDERCGPRTCRVDSVSDDGYVKMQNLAIKIRPTRVAIRRMHKSATGWALVSEPSS